MSMGIGFQHSSGRVIALGRLMLATLFLLAILADASQPAQAPAATYALLGAYLLFAAWIAAATWRDWWLEARLAGPAHGVDIVMFALLVMLTQGYTSPFFAFFVFLLLSAAIRWDWHATALTAILLTLLYLLVGVVAMPAGGSFEVQRFVVRTGHLVILSLIMIWFGAHKWRSRFLLREEPLLARPVLDQSPLESSLRAAMSGARAGAGTFVWSEEGRGTSALTLRGGELATVELPALPIQRDAAPAPFLYDLGKNRALARDSKRDLTDFAARDAIAPKAAQALGLGEGLAIPVEADGGTGELFLERVANLSTDHIDLGEQIAAEVAAHLQRHALLKAAEESAEARSRLSLARDLHDSVVQFLAGAAFRLEAMKRSAGSGRDLEPELNELKQLMLQEQRELRTFIAALRSGPLVALNDVANDLRTLAERLSRQWDIACEFSARPADLMVPSRLHLDMQQLMREAVANAVRHAEAKSVTITLTAVADELQLDFVNDGAAAPKRGQKLETPMSLKERVDQAGGTIDLARGMDVFKVSVRLPIGGRKFR